MANPFVNELEIGTIVEGGVFLLAEWSLDTTKAGAPYLKAVLADKTGRIEARYWDVTEEVTSQLETGSGVRIDGSVEEYPPGSGKRQLRIDQLLPVAISDFGDFLPTAKRDLAEMRAELEQLLGGIQNPHLSALLQHMFSDEEFAATFTRAPAAMMYHHACIGGLLEHSLAVVRLCSFLSDEHPELDRDLLVTAALLHDVGKMTAYTAGPSLDFTDEGRLIDHLAAGVLIAQRAIDALEGFPEDLRNRLLHAILAHHGRPELGSPIVPKTLEAVALHHADWLDGSVRGFLDHVDREPISGGDWTRYSKMLETQLYRPSVQPLEQESDEEEIPF